jgi:catalase (peroxidase I)
MASGRDARETFAHMAMDDKETVALVAGGHTFGKAHGTGDPALVGRESESAPLEAMGLGWKNALGTGMGVHTTTSGIEGACKPHPTRWDLGCLDMLFGYAWERVKSPAGARQRLAKDVKPAHMIPDAHDPTKKHRPMMTTADLSLRFDVASERISRHFHANPQAFADAFTRVWFKLTHRDMGPRSRYLGPEVPREELVWQTLSRKSITRGSTSATSRRSRPRCSARASRWLSGSRRPGLRRRPFAVRTDLVFGSNAGLRALAEVYASDDNRRQFVDDFVAAWDKVMNLDRFETA